MSVSGEVLMKWGILRRPPMILMLTNNHHLLKKREKVTGTFNQKKLDQPLWPVAKTNFQLQTKHPLCFFFE